MLDQESWIIPTDEMASGCAEGIDGSGGSVVEKVGVTRNELRFLARCYSEQLAEMQRGARDCGGLKPGVVRFERYIFERVGVLAEALGDDDVQRILDDAERRCGVVPLIPA